VILARDASAVTLVTPLIVDTFATYCLTASTMVLKVLLHGLPP
jgi:hypothetical protein